MVVSQRVDIGGTPVQHAMCQLVPNVQCERIHSIAFLAYAIARLCFLVALLFFDDNVLVHLVEIVLCIHFDASLPHLSAIEGIQQMPRHVTAVECPVFLRIETVKSIHADAPYQCPTIIGTGHMVHRVDQSESMLRL